MPLWRKSTQVARPPPTARNTVAPTTGPGTGTGSPRDQYWSLDLKANKPHHPNAVFGAAPKGPPHPQRADFKNLGLQGSILVLLPVRMAPPGPPRPAPPALLLPWERFRKKEESHRMSLELNPKRNRFGWFGRLGWESKKEEPSTFRLQQRIVKSRYTRNCTIARYFRLCAILRQTLNPES